jgi:hypothetical protein
MEQSVFLRINWWITYKALVKFGQHLNAYTSFDETVYFLPIPSDDPENRKGFQLLLGFQYCFDTRRNR